MDKKQEAKFEKQEVLELGYGLRLGSTSLHKIEALKDACLALDIEAQITTEKSSSEINEQPYGFEETYQGALNRAKNARERNPEDMAIGIENGIVPVGDKFFDMAVVVAISPDGQVFTATSGGIEMPKKYVDIARAKGFATTTVGVAMAEELKEKGCDATDPHSFLTNGKVSRKELLTEAIVLALSQIR